MKAGGSAADCSSHDLATAVPLRVFDLAIRATAKLGLRSSNLVG